MRAPDWIIEIVSPGNKPMDYFTKLFKYRTAGVREYWLQMLFSVLFYYQVLLNPNDEILINSRRNKDDINYVEPDISIICDKTKLDEMGCHGAPDWIIEIVSPTFCTKA